MLLSKNSIAPTLLFSLLLVILSCSSSDDNPSGEDKNPYEIGELIDVPDIGSAGGAISPKPTNEGIYMRVITSEGTGVGEEMFIYRLQHGGPSPRWLKWEEFHNNFHPSSPYHEQPDEFSVSLVPIDLEHDFCQVAINTGAPAHQTRQVPFYVRDMLVDNSKSAYTWALSRSSNSSLHITLGDMLIIKGPLPEYEHIANLPKGALYLEATPDKQEVFAAGYDVVYKIDAFGEVKTFDVSEFSTGEGYEILGIGKIRFSGEDTFFSYGAKIFKIDSEHNLDLFHVIKNPMGGGFTDFAVDDVHVFTTEGNVLSKEDGEIVANILPSGPSPTDTADYQKYIEQLGIFTGSPMEVSTDIFGNYIYSVFPRKILISPKKRFPSQY